MRLLERHSARAPLALECLDGVTKVAVTDGLSADVWWRDEPAQRYPARRSPLSGMLGVGALPGLRLVQVGPAGEAATWPALIPRAVCVLVTDTLGRYLPTSLAFDVPVAAPVPVFLSSRTSRPAPSGFATIRGEVTDDATGAALGWALVQVDTGSVVHQTVADERGRFLLYVPWPEALPPLAGSLPLGTGLASLSWDVTVAVHSEPAALVRSPGLGPHDPPELGSVRAQGNAQLVDGGPHPSLVMTLEFGSPLVLTLEAVPS